MSGCTLEGSFSAVSKLIFHSSIFLVILGFRSKNCRVLRDPQDTAHFCTALNKTDIENVRPHFFTFYSADFVYIFFFTTNVIVFFVFHRALFHRCNFATVSGPDTSPYSLPSLSHVGPTPRDPNSPLAQGQEAQELQKERQGRQN